MSKLQTVAQDLLADIPKGAHVGWVVDDDEGSMSIARAVLDAGSEHNEKTVVFGPSGGDTLEELGVGAEISVDPRVAFLGGGRLDGTAMFTMFREQITLAREQGFDGLRVLADMDWLLPADPTPDDVVAFELLLDRVIEELGATVICAYRRSSFGDDAPLAVHPVISGTEPPFRLVSAGPDTWRLAGEVDYAAAPVFAAAIHAACGAGCNVIDLSDLAFIDVSGLRSLARACATAAGPVRFQGASRSFQRFWRLGLFDQIASLDELVPAPQAGPPIDANLN